MNMNDQYIILAINPGSTSTKLALFLNTKSTDSREIQHREQELSEFDSVWDQLDLRTEYVRAFLKDSLSDEGHIDAIAARGGLLRPVKGGVYEVNELMLHDAEIGFQGEHPANLGCAIAARIAEEMNCPAYIVDPVSTSEMRSIARISGHPQIERRSLSHALSIHYVSRLASRDFHLDYSSSQFVVAHLGGGISIAPVKGGRIIDVNDANNEGPFSPSRSGTLPPLTLVRYILEQGLDYAEARKELLKTSGWQGYLGTSDGKVVEEQISNGDEQAWSILKAMAYQIGKEIGAMSTVLSGEVDSVVITGGLAGYARLIELLEERIAWIAPVHVYPGALEMDALAEGVYRVMTGEESPEHYG